MFFTLCPRHFLLVLRVHSRDSRANPDFKRSAGRLGRPACLKCRSGFFLPYDQKRIFKPVSASKTFKPFVNAKELDKQAALERAELYYAQHPGSPSAVRRPKICLRSGMWIALLGRSLHEGIAGFGPTVERALSAFDCEYLNSLR